MAAKRIGKLARIANTAKQLPTELSADMIPTKQRKSLVELEPEHCRWPYGTPGKSDFFFCGAPEAEFPDRPYCAFHTSIASTAPPKSSRPAFSLERLR